NQLVGVTVAGSAKPINIPATSAGAISAAYVQYQAARQARQAALAAQQAQQAAQAAQQAALAAQQAPQATQPTTAFTAPPPLTVPLTDPYGVDPISVLEGYPDSSDS